MNAIFAILFGFPSVVILAILSFIVIYSTVSDTITAFKTDNYAFIYLVFSLTVFAGVLGWVIADFL